MGNRETRGLVSSAAHKGGSVATSFTVRFLIWLAIIGGLSSVVSGAVWTHVYSEFGLPLGIGEHSTYRAVLFGDLVTAVVGAASVAFVGTVRR